jgi:diguanylate cyclase (GGDEF)-like protein
MPPQLNMEDIAMDNDLFTRNRKFADQMTEQGIDVSAITLFHPLSGAFNRPFINIFWPRAVKDAQRRQTCITAVFIDFDKFKQLNDLQGHGAGDQAMKLFGDIVKDELRPEDYFFSIGGDEYFLVLVGANEQQARNMVERIRIRCIIDDKKMKVRFSAGYYTLGTHLQETWEEAKDQADQKMYQNKRARKQLALQIA